MARKHQTLTSLFDAIAAAIRGKTGGTAPIVADDFPEVISGITTGVELPALSNPAGAAQILSPYEAIDGTGAKMTGTIASKTASNVTVSGRTVTVPAGYYPSQVSKSIATATQATPSISVSSAGLITASATQSAGYVSAGTKSATKQLTTQAAQTITPGTTDKTIASGRYLTGTQTIKGDANLVAANIKSGVSIFGVAGNARNEDIIQKVISEGSQMSRTLSRSYLRNLTTGIHIVVQMKVTFSSAPQYFYTKFEVTDSENRPFGFVSMVSSTYVTVSTLFEPARPQVLVEIFGDDGNDYTLEDLGAYLYYLPV